MPAGAEAVGAAAAAGLAAAMFVTDAFGFSGACVLRCRPRVRASSRRVPLPLLALEPLSLWCFFLGASAPEAPEAPLAPLAPSPSRAR